MPWKETEPVEQRLEFMKEWKRRALPFSRLCAAFGVSPKTGYKWLERFEDQGRTGLADRSRAPLTHPNATPLEVEEALVHAKAAHPTWGPRKLVALLARERPELRMPATSTAGGILKAYDLVTPRRKRSRVPPHTQPFRGCEAPNATWTADFKGEFRVGDGALCKPLTILDAFSRYALCVRGLERTGFAAVKPHFERAFREFGLPEAMRTDGGPPFASSSPCGLTRLTVWFVRLGIHPERIPPGQPQENGRHERFHLTLLRDAALPPSSSMDAQQAAFDRMRKEYNEIRPHEALDMNPPSAVYKPSPRLFPKTLPELEYPTNLAVRIVRPDGFIRWSNGLTFVCEALAGERVGIEVVAEDLAVVRFGPLTIGFLGADGRFVPMRSRARPGRAAQPAQGSSVCAPDQRTVLPMSPV